MRSKKHEKEKIFFFSFRTQKKSGWRGGKKKKMRNLHNKNRNKKKKEGQKQKTKAKKQGDGGGEGEGGWEGEREIFFEKFHKDWSTPSLVLFLFSVFCLLQPKKFLTSA